jgi:hypothetical protein
MRYDITGPHPVAWMRRTIDSDVIPTPRLISEGTQGVVEAYPSGTYQGRNVWRVRDDSYDPAGTRYRHVTVRVTQEA